LTNGLPIFTRRVAILFSGSDSTTLSVISNTRPPRRQPALAHRRRHAAHEPRVAQLDERQVDVYGGAVGAPRSRRRSPGHARHWRRSRRILTRSAQARARSRRRRPTTRTPAAWRPGRHRRPRFELRWDQPSGAPDARFWRTGAPPQLWKDSLPLRHGHQTRYVAAGCGPRGGSSTTAVAVAS
jgi:hypothetical protein